jgi:hypothetical protein
VESADPNGKARRPRSNHRPLSAWFLFSMFLFAALLLVAIM